MIQAALRFAVPPSAVFAVVGIAVAAPPKLLEADWVERDDLDGVTSIVVSPDGKHAYAAAFNTGAAVVFKRDAESGKLTHLETLTKPKEALNSAVALRLSRDGKRAAVASFDTNTVAVFTCDAESGRLAHSDSIGGMDYVIEIGFSPAADNLYAGCSQSIEVLTLDADGDLKALQSVTGGAKPLSGVRCVKVSAGGESLYAVSTYTGEVLTYQRDVATGKLTKQQRIGNGVEAGGPTGLEGVHYLDLSPDEKHLYAVSGRFGGSNAVSVFKRAPDGSLSFVQELKPGEDGGPDRFEAGNEIAVSPDGNLVYAVASTSDSVARFSRDKGTGKLSFINTIPVGEKGEPGSAGLCFSPDGKFCYIADEAANAVWGYKHRAAK